MAIASLLMGNAAGWIHIGHHHPCGETHAQAKQEVAVEHCCHDHCHPQDEEQSSSGDEPVEHNHDEHQHDSDSCSVCQNFFASRHALPTTSVQIQWQPTDTTDICLVVSEIAPERIFLSEISSRGPPRA